VDRETRMSRQSFGLSDHRDMLRWFGKNFVTSPRQACPRRFNGIWERARQRYHRRPAEGLETTSRSTSTNVAAYSRERRQTSEPGSVVCPAQSI